MFFQSSVHESLIFVEFWSIVHNINLNDIMSFSKRYLTTLSSADTRTVEIDQTYFLNVNFLAKNALLMVLLSFIILQHIRW